MPHSLRAKLSGLKHKGFITEAEYDRLKKALNSLRVDEMYQLEMENAEEFIAKSVLDKIRAEIIAIAINGQVDEHTAFIRTGEQVKQVVLDIIDRYKPESEE